MCVHAVDNGMIVAALEHVNGGGKLVAQQAIWRPACQDLSSSCVLARSPVKSHGRVVKYQDSSHMPAGAFLTAPFIVGGHILVQLAVIWLWTMIWLLLRAGIALSYTSPVMARDVEGTRIRPPRRASAVAVWLPVQTMPWCVSRSER